MVGARVLPDHEDRVGLFEILQKHRALAHADGLAHGDTACFVAHVGAIGKIVGAVDAHEQLIQEGGFVARPTRSVKLRPVGGIETLQDAADLGKGILPRNRQITVACRIVAHRMRQAAVEFKFIIRQPTKLRHRILGEEGGRCPLLRRLPGHRLHAVFAELERRSVFRIAPGAARAIETIRLVRLQHGARTRDGHAALQQLLAAALQSAPAAGGRRFLTDEFCVHAPLLSKRRKHQGRRRDGLIEKIYQRRVSI